MVKRQSQRTINMLGWYTQLWVNRRCRRALQAGRRRLYEYHYGASWNRYVKSEEHNLCLEMLGAIPGSEGPTFEVEICPRDSFQHPS